MRYLKQRVRDKRLYCTGTSGLMLIPVTHPTQCVARNAQNAGSAGKLILRYLGSTPRSSVVTIAQFNMCRIRNYVPEAFVLTEYDFLARILSRTCKRVMLHTESCVSTSQPITAHRFVLPALPSGIGYIAIGIGVQGLAVRWRLNVGYGLSCRNHIFPTQMINALLTVLTRGIRTHIYRQSRQEEQPCTNLNFSEHFTGFPYFESICPNLPTGKISSLKT